MKVGKQLYLQIVRNTRESKTVRQRVVAALGNTDGFISSGKLDDLTCSFMKYTIAIRTFDARRMGSLQGDWISRFSRMIQDIRFFKDHFIGQAEGILLYF